MFVNCLLPGMHAEPLAKCTENNVAGYNFNQFEGRKRIAKACNCVKIDFMDISIVYKVNGLDANANGHGGESMVKSYESRRQLLMITSL